MPVKQSRERRKKMMAEEYRKREDDFIKSGGVKRCGTCVNGWLCPVDPESVMPCWSVC